MNKHLTTMCVSLAAVGFVGLAFMSDLTRLNQTAEVDPADQGSLDVVTVTGIGICTSGVPVITVVVPVDCEAVCNNGGK